MPTPVQTYLQALLTKAIDEDAARIEFIPGPGDGMVRYFERNNTCHTLSVPLKLHHQLIQQILYLARLQLSKESPEVEAWVSVATDEAETRVHVTARPAKSGPVVKLTF